MSPVRALFGTAGKKFECEILCDIIKERAHDRFLITYNFDVNNSSFVCCGNQTPPPAVESSDAFYPLMTPHKSSENTTKWIVPHHVSDKSMRCFRPKLPLREIPSSNTPTVLQTPKKQTKKLQMKITDTAGFTPKKHNIKKSEKASSSL